MEYASEVAGGAAGAEGLESLAAYWPWMYTSLLAGGLVLGLVLWLFGGRLASKGVMLTGFVLGGLGAMGAAALWTREGPWLLGLGIGGAVAGVLLAWLLFRVWVALSAAVLLALVVPAATLVWDGAGPAISLTDEGREATAAALGYGPDETPSGPLTPTAFGDEDPDRGEGEDGDEGDGRPADWFDRGALMRAVAGEWSHQVQSLRDWWGTLNGGERTFLGVGAAAGAGVGLVLGLLVPLIAVSIQAATVGAALLFFTGRALLLTYAPDAGVWLPVDRRGVLLTLGLLTLLGVLVQWGLRRRAAKAEA